MSHQVPPPEFTAREEHARRTVSGQRRRVAGVVLGVALLALVVGSVALVLTMNVLLAGVLVPAVFFVGMAFGLPYATRLQGRLTTAYRFCGFAAWASCLAVLYLFVFQRG